MVVSVFTGKVSIEWIKFIRIDCDLVSQMYFIVTIMDRIR